MEKIDYLCVQIIAIMELRQLRYFVKVAETLNFSIASKELFITQSTLSQQIRQLEHELDQPLFQRNSHEVVLTEAGETLLPYARETINTAQTCVERLQDLKSLMAGELNIGVTFSFSSIAAEALILFLRKYPGVKMNVVYSPMSELIDNLINHRLDMVMAFRPSQPDTRIDSHVLFNNRLAVIAEANHPICHQQRITLDELERYDLALPAKGLQARNAFEQMLQGSNHHYRVKVEMNNVDMLFRVIRSSRYVSILSESTVVDQPDLRAIPIDVPCNDMEGCIHLLRGAYIKQAAQIFIRMVTQSTAIYKNTFLQQL